MKTERISIFNYEAFYLDHLEGNLGVEDTALLMAFLEENPELQLEDDSLPLLCSPAEAFADDFSLSEKEKNGLKQTDDDDVITLANVDYFLISAAEGLLPAQKQNELTAFIEAHREFAKDRDYYNALTVTPDLSKVYTDKSDLKKKAIVLWPYYLSIAAAASVIIAFFLLTNTGAENPTNLAKDDEATDKQELQIEKENQQIDPMEEAHQIAVEDQVKDEVENSPRVPRRNNLPKLKNEINPNQLAVFVDKKVSPLNRRPARNVVGSIEELDIQPITAYASAVHHETVADADVAYRGFEDMTDPIAPITSIINKRLKTDVDFRTGKASKDKSGGVYIKIGKFEFLRKKHKK